MFPIWRCHWTGKDVIVGGSLVIGDPILANSPLKGDNNGKIVLILRGDIPLADKAKATQVT